MADRKSFQSAFQQDENSGSTQKMLRPQSRLALFTEHNMVHQALAGTGKQCPVMGCSDMLPEDYNWFL